ncbi:MAG: hypothetical protein AAGA65_12500 [Actinomycetota bacterium]
MNDDALGRELERIGGEGPSEEFVGSLRRRLAEREPVDSDPTANGSRRPTIWLLAAAAAVALLVAVAFRPGEDPALEVAATSEAQTVGDAWLAAIEEADRASFVALHASGFEADDTLMGYAKEIDVLTPARITDLYFDGFDAFQASLAVDGDTVRGEGCRTGEQGRATCVFTTTLIGTAAYSYRISVDLTVADGRITRLAFEDVTTEPADLRSLIEPFLETEATEEDRACLVLGFNTVGCGRHDSDFLTRYIEYYEADRAETDADSGTGNDG